MEAIFVEHESDQMTNSAAVSKLLSLSSGQPAVLFCRMQRVKTGAGAKTNES